ncbi:MFS transporter [Sphingomonas sp.]|jgi:Na+/melibiose symporter-like transporter|uniref:MFS transporter n=1 Tax=Sphingomonas sp. TaxID=28214 RepID=UPI002D810C8E|nr:MFS transporter [Sphingomonas sp.]HEU0044598.1 MFS transporter [Sphingomonas sp.]
MATMAEQAAPGGATVARRATSDAPPISLGTQISYGIGAGANGIKNAAFTTYLMFYYNQVIGVSASVVSAAIALTLLVDAIADPLIGRWSDTTRSRWGRRHPFIYGAAIPTAFLFALVWFPPEGATPWVYGLWIFTFAALTRVALSAFEIATSAMNPELTSDYRERTRLFSLRYWFGYAGAFGFTAFSLAFFFAATPEYPRGQLNPEGYVGFAFTGAAIIVLVILICGLGTHNRIPYLRQAEVRADRRSLGEHLREMGQALHNRAFLAIFGFGVLKYTAIGLYSGCSLYFGTYLFKLSGGELALLTFDSLIAATIAAPLAPVMSARIGKRASSMFFAVAGVSLGLSPLVLSYLDLFWPVGHAMLVPTLFVIGALYGAMVAISLINTSSMLADVVEDSAVKTGRHEAGVFFAASSFMQQCSSALGILATGVILTWSAFPEKPSGAVTDAMTDSLLIHYIPTVICLWTAGAMFLMFYPLTKAKHDANVDVLRAREAEARAREMDNTPLGAPVR